MYLNLSSGNALGLRTLYYLKVKDIKVVITLILQLIKNEIQVPTQPEMSSNFQIHLFFGQVFSGDMHLFFLEFSLSGMSPCYKVSCHSFLLHPSIYEVF